MGGGITVKTFFVELLGWWFRGKKPYFVVNLENMKKMLINLLACRIEQGQFGVLSCRN